MDEKNYNNLNEEEYTFRNALLNRWTDIQYLWQNKFKFIPIAIVGALLGLFLAWYRPVTYTSRVTFVVDDSKSGGGGSMLSALAGQFGFDIGGMMNTGGVLAGDNVQQLLKSEKLIKEALLTPYDTSKNYTLADKYAEVSKLKKKWTKYTADNNEVNFPGDRSNYSRLQDSLLQDIALRIIREDFSITKPDKKLTFFEANATMRDEKLSQLFCTRLIQTSTNFYIQTKTKKLRNSVALLEKRSDSIERVLNRKTYSASAANKIMLDANPAYPTSNVSGELQSRDKMVLSTIYTEVVKNLEASKTMLMQETPTIQIVDVSEYPLQKNRLKYLKTAGITVAVAMLFFAIFLVLTRKQGERPLAI